MPFRIIIAAEQAGFITAVCGILKLLSLSCVISMTTDMSDALLDYLREHDTHLLILGFSRSSARRVIREARQYRPKLRVLWVSENDEPLPEANCTLPQPMTSLRLIEAVSRALR